MQHADAALNGDMQRRVVVDCNCMDWSLAPGGQVWRKRLHRVGPAEGGQVTSLVRYVPGARFHAHEHPDGEEILVLEGHFCDEHERSGPGSYLLHPQGFSHAPFSEDGCLLFVKLRQYAGPGRVRVRRDTENMTWQTTDEPGVMHKRLYEDERHPDRTRLERWNPRTGPPQRRYPQGAELLVLAGGFADEYGDYGQGLWMRLPPGSTHRPVAGSAGCDLYAKIGGVEQLAAA